MNRRSRCYSIQIIEDEEAALTGDKRRSRSYREEAFYFKIEIASGWRWEEHKERKDRLRDRVQLTAEPKPRWSSQGCIKYKDLRLNRKMALGSSDQNTLHDNF